MTTPEPGQITGHDHTARYSVGTPIWDGLVRAYGDPHDPLFGNDWPALPVTDACGEPFPCAHRAHDPNVNHPDANPDAAAPMSGEGGLSVTAQTNVAAPDSMPPAAPPE